VSVKRLNHTVEEISTRKRKESENIYRVVRILKRLNPKNAGSPGNFLIL
jgi:hypothetical protein